MLEVRFSRDARGRLRSIVADGHTEAADPGEDLVCASASAILQAAYLGLREHAQLSLPDTRRSGTLTIVLPKPVLDRDDVVAIVRTAELAIEALAHQYPQHLRYERGHDAGECG